MCGVSIPKSLILIGVFSLIIGVVMLIPSPTADAAPPLCDGKPATIVGTSGDDVLRGTEDDDVIVGLGGDDRLMGRGGNDTICGKDGNDTLIGGSGDDLLLGGGGSDQVSFGMATHGVDVDLAAGTAAGWGSDTLASVENVLGSPFADRLIGNNVANEMQGSAGADLIVGRGGDDWLKGGPDDDVLRGNGGRDMLDGHDGGDTLDGGPGDDIVRGWAGEDTLAGAAGSDRVVGGAGSDWVSYRSATVGVGVDLGEGRGGSEQDGWDELVSVENMIGSPFGDTVTGDNGANAMMCGDGGDVVRGGRGRDVIGGGPGDDVLYGEGGSDVLDGHSGDDELTGGYGDDILRAGSGDDAISPGGGDDRVWGGDGSDIVSYEGAAKGVEVDLAEGVATGQGQDTLAGVSGIVGSNRSDILIGNDFGNVIRGMGGNDAIQAGFGADAVWGNAGYDVLDGGPGVDVLHGGTGRDECRRGETIAACWPELVEADPDDGDDFLGGIDIGEELFAVKGETFIAGTGPRPAVFVYKRVGNDWVPEMTIVPTGYPSAEFGGEIAIVDNRVYVGDPAMDTNGAVWIYTHDADAWTRRRVVLPVPPNGERLGFRVASDGHRIVTAARLGEYAAVLTPEQDGWRRDVFHIGGPVSWGGVRDVAVDGDVVVVGFPEAEVAYVFDWNGTSWERSVLSADSTHAFGDSVQVEGERIAIGASGGTPGPGGPGSLHVFDRDGDDWVGSTIAVEGEGFGESVALSGSTILAGTSHSGCFFNGFCEVIAFTYRNGDWQTRPLAFPPNISPAFGSLVLQGDFAAAHAFDEAVREDKVYWFEPPP